MLLCNKIIPSLGLVPEVTHLKLNLDHSRCGNPRRVWIWQSCDADVSHVDSLSGFTRVLPVNGNVHAMHVVTLSVPENGKICLKEWQWGHCSWLTPLHFIFSWSLDLYIELNIFWLNTRLRTITANWYPVKHFFSSSFLIWRDQRQIGSWTQTTRQHNHCLIMKT